MPDPARNGSVAHHRQATFDDLGTPLHDLTFVVVDLETTGGSPTECAITEIGAVKVRGGQVLAEFHSLVNPGHPIPGFVAVLTGITDATVARSPTIDAVLPGFLEFARGSVLVAHNAPFDVGFLRAAAAATNTVWPTFPVLDTAKLARRTLDRDEAPNCKLATLAKLFRASTTPTHRALDDARATVDVLHGLFERLGCFGVTTWEDIETFSRRVSAAQQRKRHLADAMPRGPGVYLFRDAKQRILYVGKSVDVRSRVKQYFTASEQRRRMAEMVAVTEDIIAVPCPTTIEAEVHELRLIAEHKPPYNSRAKFPEKASFVTLTDEPFARLSIVQTPRTNRWLGPFASRRSAQLAVDALHDAVALRQCTPRLARNPKGQACVLAEIGRCGAPCDGTQSLAAYAEIVDGAGQAMSGNPAAVIERGLGRINQLAETHRYEAAAVIRDRVLAFVTTAARGQRLAEFAQVRLLVAARATDAGGYEVVVVRHGRLCATAIISRAQPPRPTIDALITAGAQSLAAVTPKSGPTPYASAAETECVLRWLVGPGVRLIEVDGTWASDRVGAQASLHRLNAQQTASAAASFRTGDPSLQHDCGSS